MNIIIIDSANKRVEINSKDPLTPAQILQELAMAEHALTTATQDFCVRTKMHIIPKEYP